MDAYSFFLCALGPLSVAPGEGQWAKTVTRLASRTGQQQGTSLFGSQAGSKLPA